ncbi:MAG: NUDIX domain-containing protein [Alphaproteobacteria bacterium]|nr:NUDIX domain-containing protein [Alphaproteobacteria bacterium]MCB9929907.1 NUDIX domain-containing protein [Alphaproteobacteria bacterium]
MPDQVKILSRRRGFDGFNKLDVLQLQHEQFAGGMGPPIEREVLERGQAVAVIPYDPQADRVVLIQQFRIGALAAGRPPWMTEVVAGRIDPGETAADVAHREAMEEIGRPVDRLELLAGYMVNPACTTESITLFAGRVDSRGAEGVFGLTHEGEDIRVFSVPADEALGWIGTDRVSNATFLIALQSLALNRERLRRIWRD